MANPFDFTQQAPLTNRTLPPIPTAPPASAPPPAFDMNSMMAAFAQMLQQSGAQRLGQQREALQGVRLGRYGTPVDPVSGKEQGNPFDNGFFRSPAERSAVDAAHAPSMGFTAPPVPAPAPAPTPLLPFTSALTTPLPPRGAPGMEDAALRQNARLMRARSGASFWGA